MYTFLIVLHVVVAIFLILVVLLQTGKGAAMGSAFGSGASQTMFGSAGAGNFLTKLTTAAAIIFMITSLTLTTLISKKGERSVIKDEPVSQTEKKPANAPPVAQPSTPETK
jgi:preprotein translocase subunit SecG